MSPSPFDELTDQVPANASESQSPSFEWWKSLRHHRLLISESVLPEHFPAEDPSPLSRRRLEDLSLVLTRFQTGSGAESLTTWLDFVLHEGLGLNKEGWTSSPQLGQSWSSKVGAGESVRPRRVWQANSAKSSSPNTRRAWRLRKGKPRVDAIPRT